MGGYATSNIGTNSAEKAISLGIEHSNGDGKADVRSFDSDSDGLSDLVENPNADGEFTDNLESDATDPDGDSEGLLDGAETDPYTDTVDDDTDINVNDDDSNDDNSSDYTQTVVVLRTDATDNDGNSLLDYVSGSKIAAVPQDFDVLQLSGGVIHMDEFTFHSYKATFGAATSLESSVGGEAVPLLTPDRDILYGITTTVPPRVFVKLPPH